MMPSLASAAASAVCTIYAGGMSYILQASALDQKVFDFAAPKFREACAFGFAYSLTFFVLEAAIRNLTHTRYEAGVEGPTSDYRTIYKICHTIAQIISAFGSTYLLRQMNYSVSYRFAVICVLPIMLFKAIRVINETTDA